MTLSHSKWIKKATTITFEGRAFIDGHYCDAQHGNVLERISPVDGRKIGSFSDCSKDDVDRAVKVARLAFEDGRWKNRSLTAKKKIMFSLADLIEQHSEELALMDTLSMGKAISQCLSHDIPKAVECIRWYAEAIDKIYDKCVPPRSNAIGLITKEPIGVAGAITPWNYPMENIAWKIAPALAAGNSIVLKPAEQSTFSALLFARLAAEAGIPDGILNVLPGPGEVTGKAVARHPDIDAVFFTGSTAVGKLILRYTAESNMKRVALECGGKSPFIILKNCSQLDTAAETLARNIFMNQGQICSAPSRLIIESCIHDKFIELLLNHIDKYMPANPLLDSTIVGAMVSKEQLDKVTSYVEEGVSTGATVIVGGKCFEPVTGGCYYTPTILTNVKNEQEVAQEEIFGPVLCIITAKNQNEAVALANQSKYGLAASIWTDDITTAHNIAQTLKSGTVHINCYGEDDITAPFGGYKQSGNGSKDKSLMAFDDFMNTKTTWISIKR